MVYSIEKLLTIFYNQRGLFEILFEKRNQSIKISDVINETLSYEKLQFFNQSELIILNDDNIELDDRIIEFFEEFLDTSRDIKIGAIDDIIDHLKYFISNLKEPKNNNKHSDIIKIRRYLKQIPILILKNIIQLSLHIGLVYKTSDDFKSKINALNFYQTRLEKLIIIKEKIEKLLLIENNFFTTSYDIEVIYLHRQLKEKLNDLEISLLNLQKDVTLYINRSLQKAKFWEKLLKLKEYSDNYELKEKTNIVALCQNDKMPLAFNKTNTTIKTQLSKDIIFSNSYSSKIKKLLNNKKLKKAKEKYANEIDQESLDSIKQKNSFIDTNKLNNEFLSTSSNLFEFILYKNFPTRLNDNEILELFCKMLLLYEDSYTIQNKHNIYKNYNYILVYPKGLR